MGVGVEVKESKESKESKRRGRRGVCLCVLVFWCFCWRQWVWPWSWNSPRAQFGLGWLAGWLVTTLLSSYFLPGPGEEAW